MHSISSSETTRRARRARRRDPTTAGASTHAIHLSLRAPSAISPTASMTGGRRGSHRRLRTWCGRKPSLTTQANPRRGQPERTSYRSTELQRVAARTSATEVPSSRVVTLLAPQSRPSLAFERFTKRGGPRKVADCLEKDPTASARTRPRFQGLAQTHPACATSLHANPLRQRVDARGLLRLTLVGRVAVGAAKNRHPHQSDSARLFSPPPSVNRSRSGSEPLASVFVTSPIEGILE